MTFLPVSRGDDPPAPSSAEKTAANFRFWKWMGGLLLFIRKLRWAYGVCIGFTNGEYRIVCVDFIVALRRTKGRGRRTLRSPPSPSSGLHLIHPGYPLRRGTLAAAVDRDIGFRYPVLSLLPSSEYCLAICVRAGIVRVSGGLLVLDRSSFIIGGEIVRACGYVRFCYGLSLGLPLTAPFQQFRIEQAHFTNCAGWRNIVKSAFVRLKLHKNRYPIQYKPLTIQVIPHRLSSFPYSLSY